MAVVERGPLGPCGRGQKTQQFSGDAVRKLLEVLIEVGVSLFHS